MGLNIAAAKAKLAQFNRQTDRGSRGEALWKPTEGKHVVRIVPWKENKESCFVELYFHYNFRNRTYLSPTSYGNRDPILEFAEAIAPAGSSKDDWTQSLAFRPKLRTFCPVIVRGEEAKGVRWMAFGKTVYAELLSIIADPDYGDITDVKNGRDIVVEHIPKKGQDSNTYAKTLIRPKPNQTPLADSAEKIQEFLTNQPDLRAVFKEPTYEELKVALDQYVNDGVPVGTPEEEAEEARETPAAPQSSTTATKSTELKSQSIKDMADEFDAAFD